MHTSSKKAKVDHNPSSVGKKAKKDAATVLLDPNKPITIYELLRPDKDNKPVYVGRTCDLDRRTGEHKVSTCPLVRLITELNDISIRDNIRPVPELPHGVPASRGVEMEAYFIMQRDTVYHATRNPYGCNTNNGTHLDQLTPERYSAFEAELAAGYEWPVDSGLNDDIPEKVANARGKEAVAEEIVAKVAAVGGSPELVDKLRGQLALVTADRETTERLLLSARMMAEGLADAYKVAGIDAIDREQLTKELNLLKEKIDVDGDDDVINGIVNSVLLAAKPQREVYMSSDAASLFVGGIAKMLATREEERLVWTNETVKTRMYEVRAWSRRNGMNQPATKTGTIYQFLANWKLQSARQFGGECTDFKQSLFVMRDFPWFKKEYVDRKDSLKSVVLEANRQLNDGFGWHTEPEFDGKKSLKCGSPCTNQFRIYHKINKMVHGKGYIADVERIVQGLPELRANWYRKEWTSNEKEAKAECARRRVESKRKREEAAAGGAASSSVPEENAKYDEDGEDDNDDEDDY